MGFCGEVFGTATMIQKKPSALKKSAFEIPIYKFSSILSEIIPGIELKPAK